MVSHVVHADILLCILAIETSILIVLAGTEHVFIGNLQQLGSAGATIFGEICVILTSVLLRVERIRLKLQPLVLIVILVFSSLADITACVLLWLHFGDAKYKMTRGVTYLATVVVILKLSSIVLLFVRPPGAPPEKQPAGPEEIAASTKPSVPTATTESKKVESAEPHPLAADTHEKSPPRKSQQDKVKDDRDADADKDKDRDKDKDKERDKDREKDRDRDNDKERDRDRDKERDRSKENDGDKEKDRDKDKNKDKSEKRDKDRSRGRDRSPVNKDRSPERKDRSRRDDRDKSRTREGRDRSKSRDRKSREKDKGDRSKSRSRRSSRDGDDKKKERSPNRSRKSERRKNP